MTLIVHCYLDSPLPPVLYKSDKVWYVSVAAIKETELTGEPKAQFVNLVCALITSSTLRLERFIFYTTRLTKHQPIANT